MLHHTPGDAFRLVIFDNGVGLAHEIDSENPTTMGLQIVRDLARQLEGNIEFQQNGGTTVLITFPNRDSAS